MSKDEEILRRMVVEIQLLQGTAENLQSRIGYATAALNDLQRAIATVEGLKEETRGSSLLVPIGGGSYLKAKIEDAKTLIVGIGADVASEKSIDDAQESLQTRLLKLEQARDSLQQQLEEITTMINKARAQLQTLSERSIEGRKNVRRPQEEPE